MLQKYCFTSTHSQHIQLCLRPTLSSAYPPPPPESWLESPSCYSTGTTLSTLYDYPKEDSTCFAAELKALQDCLLVYVPAYPSQLKVRHCQETNEYSTVHNQVCPVQRLYCPVHRPVGSWLAEVGTKCAKMLNVKALPL
jgi:hypothetical protein